MLIKQSGPRSLRAQAQTWSGLEDYKLIVEILMEPICKPNGCLYRSQEEIQQQVENFLPLQVRF